MPKRSSTVALLGLAAFTAAVHLLLSLGLPGPSLLWDGTAYLSLARWLAGEHTPELGHLGQYHLGYPILLIPVVWATSSLDGLFDGVRIVHALTAAGGAVVLAAVARHVFGARPLVALAVAAAGIAYPGFAMQSGLEWAEILLTVLTWSAVLAHLRAFEQPTIRRLAVAVLVVAAAYLVHPTGLVLVVATALVLATVRPRRPAAMAGALLLVATVAAWGVNQWALDRLWSPGAEAQSANLVGTITDVGLWDDVAARALGSLWYVSVASFGLAALGVAAVVHLLRTGTPGQRRTTAWLALAAGGTVALTGAKFASAGRPDHLTYGRYVDAFVPLLVVAGIVHLADARRRQAIVLAAGVVVTAIAGWLVVLAAAPGATRGTTMPANIFGVLALDGASAAGVDVAAVSVVAAAVAAAVLLVHLGWRRPTATAALLLVVFLASDVLVRDDVRALSAEAQQAFQLADVLHLVDPDAPVSLDLAVFDARGANRYQLVAQRRVFTPFDSRRGETPDHQLVIAGQDPADPPVPGARAVFPEPSHEQLLWVVPGPLQDELGRRGLLLARPGDELPPAFFEGEVVLDDARRGAVDVVVRKLGDGAPWARSDSAPGVSGAVDVEVVVAGRRTTARLPRTLFPGEEARVRVPVSRAVGAGEHRVTVRLVVDGGARGFARTVGNLRFP